MSDSRDDCALKCLEDSSQNDLGTEIEALNNCRHPNIVRLFGHFNVERVQPETLSFASCTLNATGRCRVTLSPRQSALKSGLWATAGGKRARNPPPQKRCTPAGLKPAT